MPADFEPRSLADTVEIAPGVHMPRLGLGTYKADEGPDVEAAVAYGLSIGYRLIDTAAVYGNEAGVGRAAARGDGAARRRVRHHEALERRPGLRIRAEAFDVSLRQTRPRLRRPLSHPLAVVQAHARHVACDGAAARRPGAPAQSASATSTRTTSTNSPSSRTTMPAVNQCELHPRLQQPELQAACAERGITLQAWAPLMRGRVNLVPELVEIASRHDKTPAQVSIRWILQKGIVHHPQVHPRSPASPRTATSSTSSSLPRRWR